MLNIFYIKYQDRIIAGPLQPTYFGTKLSTQNYQHRIIKTKLSTQNYQHKIINTKLSTQNYQHKIINTENMFFCFSFLIQSAWLLFC